MVQGIKEYSMNLFSKGSLSIQCIFIWSGEKKTIWFLSYIARISAKFWLYHIRLDQKSNFHCLVSHMYTALCMALVIRTRVRQKSTLLEWPLWRRTHSPKKTTVINIVTIPHDAVAVTSSHTSQPHTPEVILGGRITHAAVGRGSVALTSARH